MEFSFHYGAIKNKACSEQKKITVTTTMKNKISFMKMCDKTIFQVLKFYIFREPILFVISKTTI